MKPTPNLRSDDGAEENSDEEEEFLAVKDVDDDLDTDSFDSDGKGYEDDEDRAVATKKNHAKKVLGKTAPQETNSSKPRRKDRKKLVRVKHKCGERCVMYIGHIPHGFYEEQIHGFFSQFGNIRRLRLSRSKKTGRSKGYGFIEFADEDVAAIAAETMNNYLLFGQILKCSIVSDDKIHPKLFKGCSSILEKEPRHDRERMKVNKQRTEEQTKRQVSRLIARDKKRRKRIQDAGIEYDYDLMNESQSKKLKKAKHLRFNRDNITSK